MFIGTTRPAFKKKRRVFRTGYDRVGGYYGRYAGRQGELKFHDVIVNDPIVQSVGDIQNGGTINVIPQGITEKTRVGRKCTIRQLHWRYQCSMPEKDGAVNPTTGDTVRIMLYLDKQCNGATALVTDILETANMKSFRNLANSGRFTILKDQLVTINYMGMASEQLGEVSQARVVREYTWSKMCNIPIEFNDAENDGSLATIRSNNIGLLLISDNGRIGFESKVRMRFSDN